jgi:hypothetical protein
MDTSPANEGPNAIDPPATSGDGPDSFFSGILTPGSSLNPTFLLIVDFSFVLLVAVLFSLLIATGGNLHFAALLLISLALWASVKWCAPSCSLLAERADVHVIGSSPSSRKCGRWRRHLLRPHHWRRQKKRRIDRPQVLHALMYIRSHALAVHLEAIEECMSFGETHLVLLRVVSCPLPVLGTLLRSSLRVRATEGVKEGGDTFLCDPMA